jgi:hypothetical protein
MPIAWSAGWLLQQMILLDANPEKWWNEGGVIGFGLEDPDYDPAFDEAVEPPPGYESLPFYEPPEVNDGE